MEPVDDKYIVFKKADFVEAVLPRAMNMATAEQRFQALMESAVPDAVVIRRQDLLAAPALATYSDCIGLVSRTTDDKELQRRLTQVADYFHQQAQLAADEGYKWPD